MNDHIPEMSERQREAVTASVLLEWQPGLKERRAIPGVLIGVITAGADRPNAVLFSELPPEMTIEVLRRVLASLEAGRVVVHDRDPERN